MLLSALAACKGGKGQETPTSNTGADEQTEPVTEAPAVKKELVFEDFGNREFTMLARAGRTHYLFGTDSSASRVEQAAYTRNEYVNENFNIEIVLIPSPTDTESSGSKAMKWWKNAVTLSTGEYDLIVPDYYWMIEQTGCVENLLELPKGEIDPNDEWWYSGWNDATTINGKLFSIVGDASLEALENIEITFFNKQMAANNNMDLYTDVEDGDWTLNLMREYSKTVGLNLDEPNDPEAVYGSLYDRHSVLAQCRSAGLRLININENGLPEANYNNSTSFDIAGAVANMFKEKSVQYESVTARGSSKNIKAFKQGRALFYNTALFLGQTLKNSNLSFDYGVIPMPKYNEEQADYISTIYGVSFFAIPTSVQDVHCSATILNALNWLSNPNGNLGKNSLVYQYFETVLKNQVADDAKDADMIQMARDRLYIDFAFIYNTNLKIDEAYLSAIGTVGIDPNKSFDIVSALKTVDEGFGDNLRELISTIYA